MPATNDFGVSGSHSISCPECKATISNYGQPGARYYGCLQCGAFFEYQDGSAKILRLFNNSDVVLPAMDLGIKAMIEGQEYVMVGYMRKRQADDDDIYWSEYAFYRPGEEWYVIFAEYNGHWMMVWRPDKQNYEVQTSVSGYSNVFDGTVHLGLQLSYKFNIIYAQGAFDWNILDDERLVTNEYVSPPRILVNELRDDRSNWFCAEYISPSLLMRMMPVAPEKLPPRPWRLTPAKFYPAWKPLWIFTGVLLALLVCVQLYDGLFRPAKKVFSGTFTCEADTASWGNWKPVVSSSFEVKGPTALRINLSSNAVDNSWLELPVALINDKDGKVYEIDKTIELYHGVEDGESWSEGDYNQDALLSSIPTGSYHLNIYPSAETRPREGSLSFMASVTQNTFLAANFWIMLFLIITYPVIQLIRKYYFENSKWFDKEYGNLSNN